MKAREVAATLILVVFGLACFGETATIKVSAGSSINAALEKAVPGDIVFLEDGVHKQDIKTVRDGEPDKYITIAGSRKAVVNGDKEHRMIEVNHSYIHLDGFTIDGKKGSGKKAEDYVDKGVYVIGTKNPEVVKEEGGRSGEYESSLDGFRLTNTHVLNFGGECVRLRSFITNAEVTANLIESCGVHDFQFPSSTVNGEAIYVGTSSNQHYDGKNSRQGPDLTKYVHIHHNEIIPRGNECVDVKEGTTDVLVEYNTCSEQLDANSAGLDSRADDIIFRYNEVFNTAGAGVRIGGHTVDGKTYGLNNEVYGNVFFDNDHSHIKIVTGKDHVVCENKCKGKGGCVMRGNDVDLFDDSGSTCSPDAKSKMMDPFWTIPGKVLSEVNADVLMKDEMEEEGGDPGISMGKKSQARDTKKNLLPECTPLGIKTIVASEHDGNVPHNAVDGKAATRWSAKSVGAWIEIELENESMVCAVEMAFYKGDSRTQYFEVYGDGQPILKNAESSGKTMGMQEFPFDKPRSLRKITVFGNGNTENDWSSITNIIACGDKDAGYQDHDVSAGGEACEVVNIPITGVTASGDDGNVAENVLKQDSSRWSCKGSPCELTMTLEGKRSLTEFSMVVYRGNERIQAFDLEVETEEGGWVTVIEDGVSVKTKGVQSFDVGISGVKRVKFSGYGSDVSEWNSVVSVNLTGCKD